MLLLVGLATQLVLWSHGYDPRFYKFLGTAPGKVLSELMEWPNLYNKVGVEKALEDYSDEELRWKKRIERRINKSWPTHTLYLLDGSALNVRILSSTPTSLQIREYLGRQGRLDRQLEKDFIQSIESFTAPFPEVTLRDIHFQMEHPKFEMSFYGHYTVLTDAPYHQVASSVEALENLHTQFVEVFKPLIRFPENQGNLQVLFFSNESDYRKHQRDTAPDMQESVGYYSPLEDRMVVFNQQYSESTDKVRSLIEQDAHFLLKTAKNPLQRQQILLMKENADELIRDHARLETLATLRHEGAHHLAYTYGVHSWIHIENAWLIEGLASYFEAVNLGIPDDGYMGTLYRLTLRGLVPNIDQLIRIRKPEDFESELPGLKAHHAYALSWSLIHFCMGDENRDGFFAYLREIQSPKDIKKIMETPRTELLAKHLGLSPAELNQKWQQHIQYLLMGQAPI